MSRGFLNALLVFATITSVATGGQWPNTTLIVLNFTASSVPLRKGGLGSLFGASSIAGGTSFPLLNASLRTVAQSQGRIGENGGNPFSTEAVAPVLRGTGARMIARFNDLCYGFPYLWPGLTEWRRQVTAAASAVGAYRDVLLAVAPLNEPDNKLNSSAFMSDPLVGGGDVYEAPINWLWTDTVTILRGIDPSLPIMGPNYEFYRPWERPDDQDRVQAFLINAIATGTVPGYFGWHSLGPSPGDIPAVASSYYRPLESALGLPALPLIMEEYGPDTGDFEGVPSYMLRFWASMERAVIVAGSMGIYANGGLLGNTLRYAWQNDSEVLPNGGWWVQRWYHDVTGATAAVHGGDQNNI